MIIYSSKNSFSLVETLVVIAILAAIFIALVPVFIFFGKRANLDSEAEKISSILKSAQNKTLSSQGSSQYGVYFNAPNQYILFKGENFAEREASFDKVFNLPSSIEIYEISLGGGNEVVFENLTGFSNVSGFVSLELVADSSKNKTIYIEDSGYSSLTAPVLPSDPWDRDFRHVHFDYSRLIDEETERIILNFEGGVSEEILIVDFLDSENNFYWEGSIEVLGESQFLKIHTHRLNNPDTEFCLHRDARHNNKALEVFISGDGSGYIAKYPADGSDFLFESIYVSSPEKQ